MIQPSLTGLVHALFATQHCVLGYYQAVPAGLHATNSCRSSGLERNAHRTERLWVRSCHDSAVPLRPGVPWGKAGTNVETRVYGLMPVHTSLYLPGLPTPQPASKGGTTRAYHRLRR